MLQLISSPTTFLDVSLHDLAQHDMELFLHELMMSLHTICQERSSERAHQQLPHAILELGELTDEVVTALDTRTLYAAHQKYPETLSGRGELFQLGLLMRKGEQLKEIAPHLPHLD